MKSRAASLTAIVFVLLLVTFLSSSPAAGQPAPVMSATGASTARDKAGGDVAPTPSLMFIENVGQFAEGARYKVHGATRAFWLADDAIWITLLEPAPPTDIRDRFAPDALMQPEAPRRGVNLRITFPGANPDAELSAYRPVDTTISYFLGNDPEQWRPDVPVWAGVQYRDLYPGLDLVWDSAGERPGLRLICRVADCETALADVQLLVEGADALALEGDALRITTEVGDYSLPPLTVADSIGQPLPLGDLTTRWQDEALAAPFAVWSVSGATHSTPTDDPLDLLYSTFLGGNVQDIGYGVALDAAGNATLAGDTVSFDFPTTPGAFDTEHNGLYGNNDAFVARLNAEGSALIYSTFLGGITADYAISVVLDSAGNATITGFTSGQEFPTTPGAFDTTCGSDVFVARLSAAGTSLLYSTCLGGNGDDYGNSLALDEDGNATLTGYTDSTDFPTTPGAFDTSPGSIYSSDAFVARLNNTASALLYSTYLGGGESDEGLSLAVDAAGNATITGWTGSDDFPTTAGAFDTSYNGGDAFVTRLNATGSALIFSTLLGGTSGETGASLALDAAGNATFTGITSSWDFPTTPGAFDTSYNGGGDAFVTRLNATGSALIYSTFLGGSDVERAHSEALDAAGNAVLTGETQSPDFPSTADAFDTSHNGDRDVFVTRLNAGGSALLYSTFLGGVSYEKAYSVALNDAGNAILTGSTLSTDFPTTIDAFDTTYNGDADVYVTALTLEPVNIPPAAVTDLLAAPDSTSGALELRWTAPADANGNAVSSYDIRYSNTPIDNSNWSNATQVSDEPAPGDPGTNELMVFTGVPPVVLRYFALRSLNAQGLESALSNVPSFQDMGFRPNPSGYSFSNYRSDFPDGDYDFRIDALIEMFGQDAVCWMVGGECIVRPSAYLWHIFANRSMNRGHGYGLASTSTRFFNGADDPADFQPGAANAYDLTLNNTLENTAYHYVLQLTDPIGNHVDLIRQADPSDIVNDLYSFSAPPVLFLHRQNRRIGHAMTPYALSDLGDGNIRLYVYDNSHPDDIGRYVEVDTNAESWSYAIDSDTIWTGNASTDSLGYVPITLHDVAPECPWCNHSLRAPGEDPIGQLWTDGGHLLVTNAAGQRIGFDGNTFVNEISGARANPLLNGLENAEPTYSLPLTEPYTISLRDDGVAGSQPASVMQVGPDFAAMIGGLQLTTNSQDELVIAQDGRSVSYQASESREISITLALESTTESLSFTMGGANLAADKAVALLVNSGEGQLIADYSEAGSSVYAIQITRTDSSGQHDFLNTDIAIDAGDTHFFDFADWDGEGEITLCTDVGSDGDIDDCVPLENELNPSGWPVYLPLMLR